MSDLSFEARLAAIFAAYMNALAGDLDRTPATMAPNSHPVNVPTRVGGRGRGCPDLPRQAARRADLPA
jgi:hypothetical protein